MDNHYYLIDDAGRLRFTQTGLRELAPYFAKAGIDIQDIDTLDAYNKAREHASPFFREWLAEKASKWGDTDQFDLLRTAVFSTTEELEKKKSRFDLKQTLRIVS